MSKPPTNPEAYQQEPTTLLQGIDNLIGLFIDCLDDLEKVARDSPSTDELLSQLDVYRDGLREARNKILKKSHD